MTTEASSQPESAAAGRSLEMEVIWGSITDAAATGVHAVGHYLGVLPQNAELVLDKAVSTENELVITDLTKRGVIRGALGDVTFIPWDEKRTVAVVGMGTPGAFGVSQLRELVASLASTVGRLSGCHELTTLFIGSGAGSLSIADSVRGFILGLEDAFDAWPKLELPRVRFVELYLDRAVAALRTLEEEAEANDRRIRLVVNGTLQQVPGGKVPVTFSYSLLLAAVARESGAEGSEVHEWLSKLLEAIPESAATTRGREVIADMRRQAEKYPDLQRLALRFPISEGGSSEQSPRIASRIVFSFDGRHVRTSAITETTTVSEREVVVPQDLFDEIASMLGQSNKMDAEELSKLGAFAFTRLLHPDLDDLFRDARPMVIDLTRSIANLPFEMLTPRNQSVAEPLGVRFALARQLRTSYSPPPVSAPDRRIERALVIGDPGEGDYALPQARDEAKEVRDLLEGAGLKKVTLLVGSPRDVTSTPPERSLPASIVTVQRLLHEGVDLVHYCGHGVYDADRPDLAGWVFGNGSVLTADDLRQIRAAPLLVVANACISTRFSQRTTGSRKRRADGTEPTRRARPVSVSETGLIPGLADEFFRQGVRDFVGAAFTVPDAQALEFARSFYTSLLDAGLTLGESVRDARRNLFESWKKTSLDDRRKNLNVSPTWGAYQHYGDPTRKFVK